MNIHQKLIEWGITRDSELWFWGKVSGTIVFLASIGSDAAHLQFGIPAHWMRIIEVSAAWITYFSAQQSTSKLPGAPKS